MNEYLEHYDRLLDELWEVAHEPNPWYDVDKVKDWGVYIWTKPGDDKFSDRNVFDICFDGITYYVDGYIIPDDAWPYINRVLAKLKEIREYCLNNPEKETSQ